MTTINRRTALLGTAALPLAPAAAMARGEFPHAEPDPAVLAYREWLDALNAVNAAENLDDDSPVWARLDAAQEAMAEVVPTTLEGLACKVRYACNLMADMDRGGDCTNPDDYQHWYHSDGPAFIESLLAYAEGRAA